MGFGTVVASMVSYGASRRSSSCSSRGSFRGSDGDCSVGRIDYTRLRHINYARKRKATRNSATK